MPNGYPYPNYYTMPDAYPQYKGLTSEITFSGSGAVDTGLQSLQESYKRLYEKEAADNQQRLDKFNQLVDVDISPVKERFRDQAVRLRDAFVKQARDFAMQDQGRLSWDHTKELEKKKQELDMFVSQYNDVVQGYKDAYGVAAGMKDDEEAQRTTFENIDAIKNGQMSLSDTYNTITGRTWMQHPEMAWNWKKDMFPSIPSSALHDGTFNLKAAEKGVYANLQDGHKMTRRYYEKERKSNPELTPEQFASDQALRAKLWWSDKTDRNGTGKEDPVPVTVNKDSEGNYFFGDIRDGHGVPVSGISDPNTNNIYANSELVAVKKEGGKWMAYIRHDISKTHDDKGQREALERTLGKETADLLYGLGKVGSSSESKDQVGKGVFKVEYGLIKDVLARQKVTLKDIEKKTEPQFQGVPEGGF